MTDKKCVIITGGASGIGLAIARRLGREGYALALVGTREPEKVAGLLDDFAASCMRAAYYRADVSDHEACGAAVKAAAEEFGGIYALINNAGITRDALLMRMPPEQFDAVISVNLRGAYSMCRHVLPYMVKARQGRIVNITSVVGTYGNAGQANYAASKAGLVGLTKSLAKEVGSRGITVNAVAPGYIVTEMTDAMPEEAKAALTGRISLGRLGLPEDVAECAAFLIGPGAAYITGQVIGVDGGMSI